MTGLDAAHRAALERLIVRARSILEQDLEAQAEGRYGINSDGTIEDEEALHLDSSALADRREIVAIVEHLRDEGETATGAVARLIREAAFTHLNRLVAIRVAEAMGLVPPSLADGRASLGFREVVEIAPLLTGDETGGYWTYLRLCGDEMAGDAPGLFDPRNPLLTLSPSVAALDDLVTLFSDPAAHEIWAASDTFGWAYQFFNTGDERRQMRDESAAPRNSRELAVRNQFFTPRYVVDFLVQNTLGRRLLEAELDSPLIDALPLLVDPPTEAGEPLRLDEVRVLDPACGSGHFLLGCYDLLERAWQLQGVEPADAAPRIVPTLWGIDIDPRCAQVASAAIVFRARRHCRDLPLPRPNVITARALPDGSDSWEQVLASLPSDRRDLVQRMREVLVQAPVLGPLLKVEERLAAEIRRHFTGSDLADGTLAEGIAPDEFGRVESHVLDTLQRAADSASSTAAERLLAAEAGDAIRFVEMMRQRYEVVLMNPPFGEPVPDSRDYLRAEYLPFAGHRELLTAFVARGIELCSSSGYVGAITSRTPLFLSTFERWRLDALLAHKLPAVVDLGRGVMEQALVEAAAYVVASAPSERDARTTFIRLLRDPDRANALATVVHRSRTAGDARIFRVKVSELRAVPGVPFSYWMAPSLRRLFSELDQIKQIAEVRQGLATGDDFRLVRAFWEVEPKKIAALSAGDGGRRWRPFAKGGEYELFWSDVHLVVDWGESGEGITAADLPGSRVQSTAYYFRPGITWPLRTRSGFSPRLLPAGCIFGHKGPTLLCEDELIPVALAWLTSRPAAALLGGMLAAGDETTAGGVSNSYEVGLVKALPWPLKWAAGSGAEVTDIVARLIGRAADRDRYDETTRRFVAPATLHQTGDMIRSRIEAAVAAQYDLAVQSIEESEALDSLISQRLALTEADLTYLDDEIGPHPGRYERRDVTADPEFVRLFTTPLERLVQELIEEGGASRHIATKMYVADRRLEVLAHHMRCHPASLATARRQLRLLPPEEPRAAAEDLLSYCVGVAFGRWDVRSGASPATLALREKYLEPILACSPGMLTGADGMPSEHAPADYPLALPRSHVLVDEPGHHWDLEERVIKAANEILANADGMIEELLNVLGAKTLREYLRKQFFRSHLARYSKSRRRAPIYWHLSVPSRKWGAWLYAPRLTRESLFAVASETTRREAHAAEAIRRLEAERDAGGAGRSARQVGEALAAEEALAEELRKFRAEADRIASLGWEPDLDDGIILCAAPLAALFPAWPDAGKEREQIREGEYSWATVSRWKDVL